MCNWFSYLVSDLMALWVKGRALMWEMWDLEQIMKTFMCELRMCWVASVGTAYEDSFRVLFGVRLSGSVGKRNCSSSRLPKLHTENSTCNRLVIVMCISLILIHNNIINLKGSIMGFNVAANPLMLFIITSRSWGSIRGSSLAQSTLKLEEVT